MKKSIILVLLVFGLMACQENTSEDPVKETNEANEDGEEKKSLTNVFEKADIALYDGVLDQYADFTEVSIEELEHTDLKEVKNGALEFFYRNKDFEGISSAYYDLNDDGVEELLLALRYDAESHVLIDLYTIVDGEVLPLFTDEMSTSGVAKRSGYNVLASGELVYASASGAGDKYGIIYELEKGKELVETYKVDLDGGDFSVIEKELENKMDLNELDWQPIGKENERTANDAFHQGDFSAIEGVWENDHGQVYIEGNTFTYDNGDRLLLEYNSSYSDESFSSFSLMEEDGMGGAGLQFYPAHSEIEFGGTVFPSDLEEDRFFVSQAEPPDEKGMYYKVSD